jgi:hypothetical protein
MLRSKKLFVSLLVVLALFTMSASATVSRLEGLGGGADPFWWDLPGNIFILHDAASPAVWPQLVVQYPNLAGGEFSSGPYYAPRGWDLERVYTTYSWGEKDVALGISLDKLYSTRYFMSDPAYEPDPLGDGGVPSRLNANLGFKLGDNMLLGFGLNYWSDMEKDTSFEQSASIIGFKAGISGVGENEWDAVLGLELPGYTNEAGGQKISEKDGSMGFHFAGRWWYDYADKAALIPNLRFQSLTDGFTVPAPPGGSETGMKVSRSQIGLGAGHNWWPVENTLVVFDFGIMLQKESYEFTLPAGAPSQDFDEALNVLPYWRIGFETTVFSWLDGRLGAERGWLSYKESGNGAPDEYEFGTSQTETYLGATAHWNRMIFDLVVHPDFIGNGPDFISGAGSSPIFSRVSLKYDFNQ